jgi:hypothetical protein
VICRIRTTIGQNLVFPTNFLSADDADKRGWLNLSAPIRVIRGFSGVFQVKCGPTETRRLPEGQGLV